MLPPGHKLGKLKYTIIAILAASLGQPSAFAGFSKVAAGLALPVPQGQSYDSLSRSTAFQGEAWYNQEVFGEPLKFHGEFAYQPYTVKGGLGANVYLTGGFLGLTIEGGRGPFSMTPFLTGDVGLVYDTLSFSGATTGTTSNSATAFALQLVPGVDFQVWEGAGLIFETPIFNAFYKNNLAVWSSVFAVRWKL